jgi:hypothetical protein
VPPRVALLEVMALAGVRASGGFRVWDAEAAWPSGATLRLGGGIRAWVVLPELRQFWRAAEGDIVSTFELRTLARCLPRLSPSPGGLKRPPAVPHRLPSRAWPAGLQQHAVVAYILALVKREEVSAQH